MEWICWRKVGLISTGYGAAEHDNVFLDFSSTTLVRSPLLEQSSRRHSLPPLLTHLLPCSPLTQNLILESVSDRAGIPIE